MTPDHGTSANANIDALNTLIRGGYANGTLNAHAVVDLVTDVRLQDPSDTTYFVDGLHKTTLANGVIGGMVATAMTLLGITL